MDPTLSASIAKFYGTEVALEVVNEALQIFGGYGYTKMYPVEKLLRDVRLLRIYEGTSEVQRVIVSGHLMSSYQPVMPALEDLPLHRGVDPLTDEAMGSAWRCRICGHVHYGDDAPDECPTVFSRGPLLKRSVKPCLPAPAAPPHHAAGSGHDPSATGPGRAGQDGLGTGVDPGQQRRNFERFLAIALPRFP